MGASPPRPLVGLARAAVDAAISAHTLGAALAERRRLGLGLRDLARFVRSQLVLSEGLRAHKYMAFDGKVFLDAFVPHWPSPAFARMMTAYAAETGRPGLAFVAYFAWALTRRCVYRCEHCYAIHTLGARDELSRADLLETLEQILSLGAGVLSLEGGEPLLRFDDLLAVLRAVRGRANPFIATTGFGLTAEKARALKAAGLVGAQISLDHPERERHNALRRSPRAFDAACGAVRLLREAGVFPIIAVCPTPALVEEGGLERLLELGRDLGAGMLQVLDPMPAGRLLDESGAVLTPTQLERLRRFHVEANTHPRFRTHPAVSVRAYVEEGCRYGCGLGGNQHCYVAASGDVLPCVYLHLSFGNLRTERLEEIFQRMRATFPHPVDGLCPVYELAPAIARARRPEDGAFLPPERVPELGAVIGRRGWPGLFRRARGE